MNGNEQKEPIEVVVLQILAENLPAKIFAEYPPDPPTHFFVLDKLSDREERFVNTASFALQAYAPTKLAAARLIAAGRGALEALLWANEISRVQSEDEAPFPDTRTKAYRYQEVFDVTYYR